MFVPKFGVIGLEYIFDVITRWVVPYPLVNEEYGEVEPKVSFPASLSPNTEVELEVDPDLYDIGSDSGLHPEQSTSDKHCCPVIEQTEVGPQKLLQL